MNQASFQENDFDNDSYQIHQRRMQQTPGLGKNESEYERDIGAPRINSGNYTVVDEKQVLMSHMADRMLPRGTDKKTSVGTVNGRVTDQGAMKRDVGDGLGRAERLS